MFFKSLKKSAKNFLSKYQSKNPASYAAALQAVGGLLIVDGLIGIDNPLAGKKRPGIFGTLGGILVGVVFLFLPFIVNKFTGYKDMTATTSAEVVSVTQQAPAQIQQVQNGSTSTVNNSQPSCSAVVKYTVAGKEYVQQSGFNSSSYCSFRSGEIIEINYNPDQPGAWIHNVKQLDTVFKIFKYAGIFTIVFSSFTFLVRLLSIVFGIKILMAGRREAKKLPGNRDLSDMIAKIRKEFQTSVFKI